MSKQLYSTAAGEDLGRGVAADMARVPSKRGKAKFEVALIKLRGRSSGLVPNPVDG